MALEWVHPSSPERSTRMHACLSAVRGAVLAATMTLMSADGRNVRAEELAIPSCDVAKDLSPAELKKALTTPEKVSEFFCAYATYKADATPEEYLQNYRRSLAEFQKNFEGDCNDFAESSCEILAEHGYAMYVVNLWPENPLERLTRGWHQVAAWRAGGVVHVLDNGDESEHPSLEAYAKSHHMQILPFGGVTKWQPPTGDGRRRPADSFKRNEELKESVVEE